MEAQGPAAEHRSEAPDGLVSSPHPVIALQRSMGNRFVGRMAESAAPAAAQDLWWLGHAIASRRGHGLGLDPAFRARMERVFGFDFGGVRIHTDREADLWSRSIRARAFTTGRDIFFRSGEYQPHVMAGAELLAHELAHVVQQGGQNPAPGTPLTLTEPGDSSEREADAAARHAGSATPVETTTSGFGSVQRSPDPNAQALPMPGVTKAEKEMIDRLTIKPEADALRAVHLGLLSNPKMLSSPSLRESELAIFRKLREKGFDSSEYALYQERFAHVFEAKAFEVAKAVLQESARVARAESARYGLQGGQPSSDTRDMQAAAYELSRYQRILFHRFTSSPGVGDIDAAAIPILMKGEIARRDPMIQWAWKRLEARRKLFAQSYPELGLRDIEYLPIARANPEKLSRLVGDEAAQVLKNIETVHAKLTPDRIWKMPFVIDQTLLVMQIEKGSGAEMVVREHTAKAADDEFLSNMLETAAGLLLGVAVALSGAGALALGATALFSVHTAYRHTQEYRFQAAAYRSAIDAARSIANEEPSLAWLVIDILSAGVDVGAAVHVFDLIRGGVALVRRARGLAEQREAAAKLTELVREQFLFLKDAEKAGLSESKWVAKILHYAHQGVEPGAAAAKRLRLVHELIEGNSRRAIWLRNTPLLTAEGAFEHVLSDELRATFKQTLLEHGEWKSLQELLQESGEGGVALARRFEAFRKSEVERIFAKDKPKTLKGASTRLESDLDLNLGGDTPAAAMLRYERILRDEYGSNWRNVLRMNLYTETSRFLQLESVLKEMTKAARGEMLARLTGKVEEVAFAKMFEHAHGDPAATKRIGEFVEITRSFHLPTSGKQAFVPAKNPAFRRRQLALEIDGLTNDFKNKKTMAEQTEAAERLADLQIEMNFYTNEAYLGPGAMRQGTGLEIYQDLLSQLEMIEHIIHEAGGNPVRACREYEIWKYVYRYAGAADRIGGRSKGMDYFASLGERVYKDDRGLQSEIAHFTHRPFISEFDPRKPITNQFLNQQFQLFVEEAKKTFREVRVRALADQKPETWGAQWR